MSVLNYVKKVLLNLVEEIKSYVGAMSNKNGFVRHSFTLSLGTAIAQGIPLIFSPILTRIFTPEEFGLFAIVSSIAAIISVISTGKYETVIVVADSKDDAANLAVLSATISLFFAVLVTIVFFFFSDVILAMLRQPKLKYWIFVSPLSALFYSVYLVYNEWCIRGSAFFRLSLNKITNSGSISLSNLFFGLTKILNGGLIFGELSGRFVTAISCIYNASKRDADTFRQVTWRRGLILAKKFKECPTFVLPGQLLNMLGGQTPLWMLSYFFSSREVGYFSVARMALAVPVSMITVALRDVFKKRANEEYKLKNNCLTIYKRMARTLFFISVFIFGILFFILPAVFSFVFGTEWKEAGEFARIFCPMVMINFVSESFTGMFYITKKLKKVLLWQILYFSFVVLSMLLGNYLFSDIKMVLVSFVAGRIIVDLISLSMTYNLAKGKN